MRLQNHLYRLVTRVAMIAITLLILGAEAAIAHGGHEHAAEGGELDTIVVAQIAGVAAVIGIGYLLASRIYRHRDR